MQRHPCYVAAKGYAWASLQAADPRRPQAPPASNSVGKLRQNPRKIKSARDILEPKDMLKLVEFARRIAR